MDTAKCSYCDNPIYWVNMCLDCLEDLRNYIKKPMKKKVLKTEKTNVVKEKVQYVSDWIKNTIHDRGCVLLNNIYVNKMVHIQCCCGSEHFKLMNNKKSSPLCKDCIKNYYKLNCKKINLKDPNYVKNKRRFTIKHSKTVYKMYTNGSNKYYDKVGYCGADLKRHIESNPDFLRCKEIGLSIDHIYPLSAFFDVGIDDPKVINHLSNLRPSTKSENSTKRDKYNKLDFYEWLKSIGYDTSNLIRLD